MHVWQCSQSSWPNERYCLGACLRYITAVSCRSQKGQLCLPWLLQRKQSSFAAHAIRKKRDIGHLIEKHRPFGKNPTLLSKEDQDFWEKVVASIDKEVPKQFLSEFDTRYPFGFDPNKSKAKPQMWSVFLEGKMQHPSKLVIAKCGEFYETIGLDAVVVMQHASLNPMGKKLPQAGAPLGNITQLLKDLVQGAGFSVVMMEEAAKPTRGQKERFISQIVTPHNPTYLFGAVDKKGVTAQDTAESRPIVGVACSVSGFKMIEVDTEMCRYFVTEGLTEDSVSALLHRGGMTAPLYVHRPDSQSSTYLRTEASVENEWAMRMSENVASKAVSVKAYTDTDPVLGLLDLVKRELGIHPDTVFEECQPDRRTRPKSVFMSTASQLGIHRTRGIPSLLMAALPGHANKIQVEYLKRLLLRPPPAAVATSIRKACTLLSEMTAPLPAWVLLDFACILRQIKARETNEDSFRSLQKAVFAAQSCLESGDALCADFARQILAAVELECRLHLEQDVLLQGCRTILDAIGAVIEPARGGSLSTSEESANIGGVEVLGSYFREREQFQGKIRRHLVEKELLAVAVAGEAVEKALREAFEPLVASPDLAKNKACVKIDFLNNAVWIKAVRGSAAAKMAEESTKSGNSVVYFQPKDKKGHLVKDMLTTEELEAALLEYRTACEEALNAVRDQLKALAGTLEPHLVSLQGALYLNNIASALEAHVREASVRGWALPQQLHPPTSDDNADVEEGQKAGEREGIDVKGMWPYWLEGRSASTVRNTLNLENMVILTGPNMAGKSTVMRSLCAVALLSACGLFAPCEAATIPYIDAFMLRTFSADSPVEGKSSFAIEMSEMRHVMNDVSENSLVLVDELGKGTEPMAGTAIAAGFLRFLHSKQCRGLFATHLHQLLDMKDLDFTSEQHMCMETVEAADSEGFRIPVANDRKGFKDIAARLGCRVPTWRIVPGTCQHSLAFVVMAQHCGVESTVVTEALRFYKELQEQESPSAASTEQQMLDVEPLTEALKAAPSIYSHYSSTLDSPHDAVSTSRPIEDAAGMLEETANHIFSIVQGGATPEAAPATTSGHQDNGGSAVPLRDLPTSNGHSPASSSSFCKAQVIRSGMEPPPATVGCSCVYIVRRTDGNFYAGETDDIKKRIKQHRNRSGKVKGGPLMEATYITVPTLFQGKSAAKEVEAAVIRSLQCAGYPLISVTDARNRRSSRLMQSALAS